MHAPVFDQDAPEARLALFDFAFDHAPIGIALIDTGGRIERGNAAFANLVGMPLTKLIGTAFAEFTHPDDIEADLTLFRQVLAGRRDGYTIEKRYIRPDSRIVFVLMHVAAMRDKSGQVVRLIAGNAAIGEDVAERIVTSMRRKFDLAEGEVFVRATVGGCHSQGKAELETLISHADQLLYAAKAAGKDCWRLSS